MESEKIRLLDKDLPSLHRSANIVSMKGQRQYNRSIFLELLVLIIAAFAGLFVWKKTLSTTTADWAGVIAAFAFIAGFILQIDRLLSKPNRVWFLGRALAESSKTLAWRYSVGGLPFEIGQETPQLANENFSEKLLDILKDVRQSDENLFIASFEGNQQITSAMSNVRSQPLVKRQEVYQKDRIDDQIGWYQRKARWNVNRAVFWNSALIFLELIGAAVAILKAIGLLQVDLLGIVGTLAAAATSWMQLKQHQTLAQSYTIAALELMTIREKLQHQTTEDKWANFVDQAEEAISREHTLWLAKRGGI